jgi:hypothetical protein
MLLYLSICDHRNPSVLAFFEASPNDYACSIILWIGDLTSDIGLIYQTVILNNLSVLSRNCALSYFIRIAVLFSLPFYQGILLYKFGSGGHSQKINNVSTAVIHFIFLNDSK